MSGEDDEGPVGSECNIIYPGQEEEEDKKKKKKKRIRRRRRRREKTLLHLSPQLHDNLTSFGQ